MGRTSVEIVRAQINLNRLRIPNDFPQMQSVGEKISHLGMWDGGVSTGPWHMAWDEAMLTDASLPVLRWYRWERPEISFGYPMRWTEVQPVAAGRPAVRRWTGGGIVEHGEDLTISLSLPAAYGQPAPTVFYEWVHGAVAECLGSAARLASREETSCGPSCFENPAHYDVMAGGRKIVGGAIRRTREGMLYQGSIQAREVPEDFIEQLGSSLADEVSVWNPGVQVQGQAAKLQAGRYATAEWLEKR